MTKFHLLIEEDGSTRNQWSRRKMLRIAIVVLVFIVSLIAIIVTQTNKPPAGLSAAEIEADRKVKLNLARLIKEEMNSTANPCSDFYLYSCGVEHHGFFYVDVELNKSAYSYGDLIAYKMGGIYFFRRVKALLNESIKANESKSLSQAKHIYQACMDRDIANDLALEPVHQLIEDLGGWPVLENSNSTTNTSLEENLASYFIDAATDRSGLNPLYNLEVSIDPDSEYTFKIDQERHFPDPPLNKSFDLYKESLRRIVTTISSNGEQNANISINDEKIDTFVNEIRRYREFRVKLEDNYTIFDGESYTGTLGNLTSNYPGFDWVKCLQIYVKYYTGHTITSDTQIYIFSLPYINAINKYLLTFDSEFFQNLKVWKTLIRYRESLPIFLMDDLDEFRRGILSEPSHYISFVSDFSDDSSRELFCLRNVNGRTVIRTYLERYLSEKSKEWVNEIYNLLKSEFKKNLENTEWLDTGAKSKMIKRLHEMKLVLGHPEHLMNDTWLDAQGYVEDLNVTRDGFLASQVKQWRFIEKLHLETALTKAEYVLDFVYKGTYYDLTKNIVFVGMKFLQPPVFDEKQPTAYKFGHLSYTMAHQIAHGFDFQSLIETESPQIQLSNNSINGFKQRNRCILNQYNNQPKPDENDYIWWFVFEMENVTGEPFRDENMCDTTGLQLAFSTYKKWKQQHELDTDYPGLNNLTSDELFFLGVSQKFCPRHFLMRNGFEHSIGLTYDTRVNMMMQNTPDFGETFQCQRGISNLYPAENKVCRVYGKTQS